MSTRPTSTNRDYQPSPTCGGSVVPVRIPVKGAPDGPKPPGRGVPALATATTSTARKGSLAVAAVDVGRPDVPRRCGEAATGTSGRPALVAAMLRLAEHFPYTTATDLALAGYDVLGYTPIPAWLVTE